MSNPIADLFAKAEVNVTQTVQGVVDRAVASVKAKSQEMVDDAVGAATARVRVVAIKAGLAAFAGIMLLVAVVFGLCALFRYLVEITSPMTALLIMAGGFAVLGILGFVGMALVPSGAKAAASAKVAAADAKRAMAASAPDTATRPAPRIAATSAVSDEPTAFAGFSENDQALNSGLDAVVSALGEAGFKREQAGLRAGLTIAKQLRPMQIVSLALLGGFLAGIRMNPRRR